MAAPNSVWADPVYKRPLTLSSNLLHVEVCSKETLALSDCLASSTSAAETVLKLAIS